jgi:two-component system sensor histidine kinase DesK
MKVKYIKYIKEAQGRQGQETPTSGEHTVDVNGPAEIIASSGISLRLWRLYAYFWLVCLFFPILYLTRSPLTTAPLIIALSGLALFTATYIGVMWPFPLIDRWRARSRLRTSWLLPVGMTLLALCLSLAYGSAFSWLFLGVSAIIGVTLPVGYAFWAVTGLTLFTVGVYVLTSGGLAATDWLQVIPLALLVRGLGLDLTGLTRLVDALWELNAARQELARQAVVEERLRMARDLHDLLGHSLSLIALKSELAGRLIGKGSSQAAQEVSEIEGVARQALREVREAIAGYRQQTLANELDGARQILEAAGITCVIETTNEALPAGVDQVLAWIVREGVTNVIRHSRARQCLIRITSQDGIVYAEVINNGAQEAERSVNGIGSGLSGLADRIAAQGGSLEAGQFAIEDKPGFRLMAKFPIRDNLAREEA